MKCLELRKKRNGLFWMIQNIDIKRERESEREREGGGGGGLREI